NRARAGVLESLGERSLKTLVERRAHLSDGQLDLGTDHHP
ncbi:RNA polymerase subunit sigma-70, partial [Mesorhizobium sp. M00.F.Ca.ET.158.01.1.1]